MAAVSTEDARNLADGLVASGRDEEAVAVYLRALTLAPSQVDEAELSMELGWLLFSLGRPDEATACAHRALRALEHHAATAQIAYLRGGSHSVLAHCEFDVDPAVARATAEIALRALAPVLSDPVGLPRSEIVWMWIDAARLSWLLGAADDCVAHCERALALEPTDVERLSCLAVYAEALRAKERFAEARERLIEALRYTKSYRGAAATLYFALGLTEHAANDLPRAHQALQEALSRGRLDSALTPGFYATRISTSGSFPTSSACTRKRQEPSTRRFHTARAATPRAPALCSSRVTADRLWVATRRPARLTKRW
jgi:tetratricopeptide (TPR) repeat protein